MRRIVLAFVLVAVTTTSARAEHRRSRRLAQVLSGVATGASSAVVLAGFLFAPAGQTLEKPLLYTGLAASVVTPSFGEWYAGEWLTYGMAARVLGAGFATFALTHEMKTQTCDDATSPTQTCTTLQGAGVAMLGIAAIAFIGGMAYDVSDAAPEADRWNLRHDFMVAPTALVTPTGTAMGLAASGRF